MTDRPPLVRFDGPSGEELAARLSGLGARWLAGIETRPGHLALGRDPVDAQSMEPTTTMSNTLATTHPFVVGHRTFEDLDQAKAFASREVQARQLPTAVRDRLTGRRVATYPLGVKA